MQNIRDEVLTGCSVLVNKLHDFSGRDLNPTTSVLLFPEVQRSLPPARGLRVVPGGAAVAQTLPESLL